MKPGLLCVVTLVWVNLNLACHADANDTVLAVRQWRQTNERQMLDEFLQFVRIPNETRDRTNIRRNADHVLKMMEKRGLSPRFLEVPDVSPVVYGELLVPNATHTYVLYAHYDGQPIPDPNEWANPPYAGTLRSGNLESGGVEITRIPSDGAIDPEWRIYSRSAADDKAGIMVILSAVSALQGAGISPRANLKFVFEGEEETGSDHLEAILAAHKELLRSDGWIICDGPIHASGLQSIVFGVRGGIAFEITVFGATRSLHSGTFGNWAPNPAMMLAQLLASMKDNEGRILIAGFYDSIMPLGEVEKQAIAQIPNSDAEQMRALKLARTDGRGARLAELINLPTLNITGLSSGKVGGQVATIIPATATAAIDIRLVKGVTRAQVTSQLIEHIRKEGYYVTSAPPTDEERLTFPRIAQVAISAQGYEAVRTPMDSAFAKKVVAAVGSAKSPFVLIPSSGGSLPLDMIERTLNVPIVAVPSTGYDNNQHAKNENLRLQNLWDGIEVYSIIYTME